VLKEKIDDLELLTEHSRRAAGAGRLNRQVEGRGAAHLQRAVGPSSQGKQLTDGGYASRANRPMKRCGTAAVASVDLGPVLHEYLDQRGLRRWIPGTTGFWPGITCVVQWGRAASVLGIRVRSRLE
jgi:hypothetical protein